MAGSTSSSRSAAGATAESLSPPGCRLDAWRVMNKTTCGEVGMKILLQLTLIALFSSPVFAQWAKVPPTPIPRGADGKPNLSAPAPRLPDGKPDLSGVWNPPTGYIRNLTQSQKEEVPYQPWAKALYDERASRLHWKDETEADSP